ncbi:MAG: xanthine dehydrogenase accessory protein XdhC [Pseudomonadota bacterium]
MADLRALTRFCLDAIEGERPVALITQCAVEGSTPRELGVRMAVTADTVHGTIGGGNLEQIAIDQARKLLGDPDRRFLLQDHPLGPLLAQCCGGHVRLLIEALAPADMEWLQTCRKAADEGHTLFLRTMLADVSPRKTVSVSEDPDQSFTFWDENGDRLPQIRPPLTDSGAMVERFGAPRPQLLLYGAGHVGRAVAEIMVRTIFDVTCLDAREDERAGLPDGVIKRGLPSADDAVASAPAGAYHVIFTHSHDLDYGLLRAVLERGDFAYVGLIGSQTKRARFLSRLREDGFTDDAWARLVCPIGTPGITSKAPEAVAIALAHELMASLGSDNAPLPMKGL